MQASFIFKHGCELLASATWASSSLIRDVGFLLNKSSPSRSLAGDANFPDLFLTFFFFLNRLINNPLLKYTYDSHIYHPWRLSCEIAYFGASILLIIYIYGKKSPGLVISPHILQNYQWDLQSLLPSLQTKV